ncbi:hypothetical protein D3C81_1570440 [compost metagenome]
MVSVAVASSCPCLVSEPTVDTRPPYASVKLTPGLVAVAPTVALVCRPSKAWALRLSVLSAAVMEMLKPSPEAGLPLTVIPTLKVLALPPASV